MDLLARASARGCFAADIFFDRIGLRAFELDFVAYLRVILHSDAHINRQIWIVCDVTRNSLIYILLLCIRMLVFIGSPSYFGGQCDRCQFSSKFLPLFGCSFLLEPWSMDWLEITSGPSSTLFNAPEITFNPIRWGNIIVRYSCLSILQRAIYSFRHLFIEQYKAHRIWIFS